MTKLRLMGSYIKDLAKDNSILDSEMADILHCTQNQIERIYSGRVILSYQQLELLSKKFNMSVLDLIKGNKERYDKEFDKVCVTEFSDKANRDECLDIIDDYLDIIESAEDKNGEGN